MELAPGLRLSVLFAESLSLREIQSRARTRAAGGSRLRLHPAYVDTGAGARALTSTRTRDRNGWTHGRSAHTLSICVFTRMSTRYRTLIEERKVHNYAARLSRVDNVRRIVGESFAARKTALAKITMIQHRVPAGRSIDRGRKISSFFF